MADNSRLFATMTAICPEFCPFWRNWVVENVAISAALKRFSEMNGLPKIVSSVSGLQFSARLG
jgi:hypothetical protein